LWTQKKPQHNVDEDIKCTTLLKNVEYNSMDVPSQLSLLIFHQVCHQDSTKSFVVESITVLFPFQYSFKMFKIKISIWFLWCLIHLSRPCKSNGFRICMRSPIFNLINNFIIYVKVEEIIKIVPKKVIWSFTMCAKQHSTHIISS